MNDVRAFLEKYLPNLERRGQIEQPLMNSALGYPKPTTNKTIRDYVMTTPEIFSRVKSVANDVLNGYEISCSDQKLKSEVEYFLVRNKFSSVMMSAYLDKWFDGSAYLEPVFVRVQDARKMAAEIVAKCQGRGLLSKSASVRDSIVEKAIAKANAAQLFEPSELWWVDSRYIFKTVDKKGRVQKYVQRVQGGPVKAEWLPDQLIDLGGYKYNNDVYSFTPLTVAVNDLAALDVTKTYIKNFFENNGVPDFLISLKNVSPESQSYKAFKEELAKRRSNYERGTLVATGEITIDELTKMRDMDMEKFTNYLGKLLDMITCTPVQKHDGKSSGSRSIDTFNAPYYTFIRAEQKSLEDALNYGLFSMFGNRYGEVKIRFNNPYLRDAVRNASWVSTVWADGNMSLSEYRAAMGLSEALPPDLKQNPNFGQPTGKKDPFKGPTADNNSNRQDKPTRKSPEELRELAKEIDYR